MLNSGELQMNATEYPELGTVLCKSCGDIIATLPTNGVKKMYVVCEKAECQETTRKRD